MADGMMESEEKIFISEVWDRYGTGGDIGRSFENRGVPAGLNEKKSEYPWLRVEDTRQLCKVRVDDLD
jgi:hypothetical protein